MFGVVNWWYSFFETLYNWFLEFASGMEKLWEWLITPINFLGTQVAPIFAVVGSMAIVGLVRRIL